jgi:hypothetical protein
MINDYIIQKIQSTTTTKTTEQRHIIIMIMIMIISEKIISENQNSINEDSIYMIFAKTRIT